MKFCPKCGTSLADTDRFCSKCGTEVMFGENKNVDAGDGGGARSQTELKPKKSSPILGIVSLVFALVGFLEDPPGFTVFISICALVLAIVALKKKSKLKGFAIAAIVFAICNIFITVFNGKAPSKQEVLETVAEGSTAYVKEENATEATNDVTETIYVDYSICGITFKIPDTYSFNAAENTYLSVDENWVIHFEDVGDGTTDDQFKLMSNDLDETTDEGAKDLLSDYVRKNVLDGEIAGFLSRSYYYTGECDGKDAVMYVDYINNTENNNLLIVLGFAKDPDKESFEADYQAVINSAAYTNVSATMTEGASQETQIEGTEGVDPDLVAFLTEYEKFIDSYCEFMKKYTDNPSDISMLTEYAKFMGQYAEFAEKVDAYDSDQMSTADAAYYIEVTARCSQKMLEVAGEMSGN